MSGSFAWCRSLCVLFVGCSRLSLLFSTGYNVLLISPDAIPCFCLILYKYTSSGQNNLLRWNSVILAGIGFFLGGLVLVFDNSFDQRPDSVTFLYTFVHHGQRNKPLKMKCIDGISLFFCLHFSPFLFAYISSGVSNLNLLEEVFVWRNWICITESSRPHNSVQNLNKTHLVWFWYS